MTCLNESESHRLKDFLADQTSTQQGKFLQSDCDAQLLLTIPFSGSVRIHSLIIEGPQGKAPKSIKLFINNRKLKAIFRNEYKSGTN